MNVSEARPILNNISFKGMQGSQLSDFFAMTKSAVAAFYPETAPRHFLAAARGAYPSSRANTSFAFSPSWKKRRSETGESYWYSPKDKLAVSLSPERAFVSDGDPFVPSPGTTAPADFPSFRQGAVLAGWLDNSAGPINQFLEGRGIPIQIPGGQILFGIQKSDTQYQATIRIETPSPSQAKALAAILSMARLFMPSSKVTEGESPDPMTVIGALFANPPMQDGPYLTLRTGLLDEKGIALLFNMFSVYSN
jgi:hypothetical protein